MEKLKEIFGDRSLTYEQFQAALELDGTVRLADLGSGGYVDRGKLDRLRAELEREREEARRELEELSARYQGIWTPPGSAARWTWPSMRPGRRTPASSAPPST
jgi:hypothetical protein